MEIEKSRRDEASERKARGVCSELRAALSSYDTILTEFSQHGPWWKMFRQQDESIFAFAARTYTSSKPAEVGMLAAAYARSTCGKKLSALVYTLIISDF